MNSELMSTPNSYPTRLRRQCLFGTAAALLVVAALAGLALHSQSQLDRLLQQAQARSPIAAEAEAWNREITAIVSSGYRLIVVSAAAAAMVLCGVALWIVRSVVARLGVMSEAAGRILAGNHGTRLACESNDEIGALASQINELGAALETSNRRVPEAPTVSQGPSVSGTAAKRGGGPYRVLVAEDGPENRRFMNLVLRKAAVDVTMADNGREAVEIVLARVQGGESPFDLILMDMEMPVMNGYDATRTLRERGYQGRIVAVTGHTRDYDRQKCLDVGCDQYVCKPVDQDTLLTLVSAIGGRADAGNARSK
jgi:CheY-like chemotaxis protein